MMEIAHGRAASGAEYKVLKIAVGIFRLSPLGLFKRFMRFFPCLPIHNRFMGIFKKPPAFLSDFESVWLCKKAYVLKLTVMPKYSRLFKILMTVPLCQS